MSKKNIVMTLVALAMVFAFGLSAEASTLTIQNTSASDIYAIYISDSGTNEWEENIIEGNYLPSGNELKITINGSYNKFDLRVEDGDGNSEDYTEFPGKTSVITLSGGGESEYK